MKADGVGPRTTPMPVDHIEALSGNTRVGGGGGGGGGGWGGGQERRGYGGGGAAAPDPIATAGMGGSTTAGLGEEVGADK